MANNKCKIVFTPFNAPTRTKFIKNHIQAEQTQEVDPLASATCGDKRPAVADCLLVKHLRDVGTSDSACRTCHTREGLHAYPSFCLLAEVRRAA